MTKASALAFVLVLGATSLAKADDTLVTWSCRVYDVLGPHELEVRPRGGKLPHTGLTDCVQEPVRVFRDSAKDLQEEVRITCKVGLTAEVQLIETCYAAKHDQSFGALKGKDSLGEFTISLACRN